MRILLCLFCIGVVAAAERKYSSKYDSVDVDRILNNDRILTNYIKCMMDEGPCTADGRELKKTLPDAIASDCVSCNEKQKTMSEKVIKHLVKNRKKDWDRLTKKYDPKGEYQKRFDALQKKQKEEAAKKAR